MEEKYNKFLEYNWRDSAEWQLYLSNLSEVPPGNKVEHFKKRFYKLKVDPDFDVKWVPQENQNTSSNYTSYTNTFPQGPRPSGGGNFILASPILAGVECFIWLAFLGTALVQVHTLKFACVALIIRILRRIGLPKMSMEYAQCVFLDEHFQILLYALLLLIDRLNLYTLVPLGITAVMNICEFVKSKPGIFAPILPYTNKILNKRVELAMMRANTLIAIGFLLVFGVFLGLNSFLTPIFLWQYLRFEYIVNQDTKYAFSRLNVFLNNFKNKPSIPAPVKFVITKVQDLGSYLGRTEPAPGQAAGGANCLIF